MRAKLSVEQKKARERMRLVEPENSYKVLGHPRYWTKEFLRLYLDRCDELALDEPRRAYTMSEHAPILAQRIRVGDGFDELRSEADKRSHRVLALSVRATTCRAVERLDEAAECFTACEPLLTEGVSIEAAAEMKKRHAGLLGHVYDPRALDVIDAALVLFDRRRDLEGRAEAWLVRGILRFRFKRGSGISDASVTLESASDSTDRGRRSIEAALHFMTLSLLDECPTLREQQQAYRLIQKAKRNLAHRPKSLRKMKVFWLEGLLLANLGITRHAVRRLEKARAGILEMHHAWDLALVSLDLACAHLGNDDPAQALELSIQTARDLESLETSAEVRQAVEVWSRCSTIGLELVELKRILLQSRERQVGSRRRRALVA